VQSAGSAIRWILIVGGALIVIAILVLALAVLDEVDKSEKRAAQVAPAKFRALEEGDDRATVLEAIGEPEETGPKTVPGFGNLRCWYYGVLAEKTYEVCFQGGGLAFKLRL
jgi:outer membrane protein assembly factor BamE (lipoprotein component of BamABCDE complex)